MAEAEDVITDAARHATVFVQDLWRRHRPPTRGLQPLRLNDVAERLDLLLSAVFGRSFPLRVAQPPAPRTFLHGLFQRQAVVPREALPATDDASIWLPSSAGASETHEAALARYRTMALQQAMRAARGSAAQLHRVQDVLQRELYLLLEARAADDALMRLLPGSAAGLRAARQRALMQRPPAARLHVSLRPLEELACWVLRSSTGAEAAALPAGVEPSLLSLPAQPAEVLEQAMQLGPAWPALAAARFGARARQTRLLWRDAWTGDLRPPSALPAASASRAADESEDAGPSPTRSARLGRRPEVRDAVEEEDDTSPGVWMVQPSPPHEQAEDPMGLQRPTDRDSSTAAEDFADAVSELAQARLVAAPGTPKEYLLSDDPPDATTLRAAAAGVAAKPESVSYPEWDWRVAAYRQPGATVQLLPAAEGSQQWVDETLDKRRGMLDQIRRRFELLRAQRVQLHRQLDGHEIDLPAFVEAQAEFRAGLPLPQRLYRSERRGRRDMAIMLLMDVSGSTDSWVAGNRRVIDVAREALLLVCIALEGLAEPYSVLAFSGQGAGSVVVRPVKRFDERYDAGVARRISGLEPENYTRVGAAIRHTAALLMRQPAEHRLLLILSDGKPNDADLYEGRYGVEDTRQAVTEARLQGISPFCLTIDRQATSYLPRVFGPQSYALLSRPELLPALLLDWLRRLVLA